MNPDTDRIRSYLELWSVPEDMILATLQGEDCVTEPISLPQEASDKITAAATELGISTEAVLGLSICQVVYSELWRLE